MKLEVGGKYKFEDDYEWFIVKIIAASKSGNRYYVTVIDCSHGQFIEEAKTSLSIDSPLFNTHTITEWKEKTGSSFNPAVVDLWIEMALQTNDKVWFLELIKRKQEVS